jgi:hypothetical protein
MDEQACVEREVVMPIPIGFVHRHAHEARMILCLVCLPILLTFTQGQAGAPAAHVVSAQKPHAVEGYGRLPLAFEVNQGQTDPQVKFVSRGAGYNLFLTSTEAVLTLHRVSRREPNAPIAKAMPPQAEGSAVLYMKLVGANSKTEVSGQNELPGKSNYFVGNDPKKWQSNVRQYAKVRYENVYPGVDLVYYGNQRALEYDFVLQPGTDPSVIRLGIEGATKLRLEQGDLVLSSPAGDVHLCRPQIYQQVNGARREIRGGYVLNQNEVGFRIASYDRRRELIVDPVLAYSSYLGGGTGLSVAVDAAGNAYLTGYTTSTDFPTANAIQPTYHGDQDAFVTKINADGTALVYSTYLGGSNEDFGESIAVDAAGNAYLTGQTQSSDFPTANAIQAMNHGHMDVFVTKINADGTALVYSTYLGGNDDDGGQSVAADAAGNAYVTGTTESTDFPTANAIQPTNHGDQDAFVTKINADGSAFIYSTYLGGSYFDYGSAIALDSAGNAYVTGSTESSDFPTVNAIQPTSHGGYDDAFVTKINASGSALVYSTYLGGSGVDYGNAIAVDAAGNAYAIGYTLSTDFPTLNAIQPPKNGSYDAFVTKINANGNALVYSTYLGGSGADVGRGIALDAAGNAYLTGYTTSTDFPTANALQPMFRGKYDAFVTKINASGSALVYSTYLGGSGVDLGNAIAVDAAGSAYVTGEAGSRNFPKTLLALQPVLRGGVFIAKIASQTFVSVSPLKLGFSTHVIGTTSAEKKLTVTNTGASSLTINKIYIAGANAGDFTETNSCPDSIAPEGTCTISVTFTPTAKDNRAGVLATSDSDPASPQAIPLTGVGTVVSLSKKALSFASQPVGTTSAPKDVTLTNVGTAQLNFTGISVTGKNAGDFSQTNTCGTRIAGGASCTITMTFAPTATGTRKAVLSISDDGGGSPQKVNLTGKGS